MILKNEKNEKIIPDVDLIITVKTTFSSHTTRVAHIVDTWFTLAPSEIYFITDSFDPSLNEKVGGHLINTTCPPTHNPVSLVCKFYRELKLMFDSKKDWSCHFDDDNYVNVPVLKEVLREFNPSLPYYIGRTATYKPTVWNDRAFWFAIGGAGICFSKAALQKMTPFIETDNLYSYHSKISGMPDDMATGYLMNEIGIELTEITNFLSQYDQMNAIPLQILKDIPILSFKEDERNFVNLPFFFYPHDDPYKFQTLHCFLYPNGCNSKLKRLMINIYRGSSRKKDTYGTYYIPTPKYDVHSHLEKFNYKIL